MRALVTGATGYLGRRVVRDLLDDGCLVRCLVRATSAIEPLERFIGPKLWPAVEIERGNLSSDHDCRLAVEDCEVVYHIAAALSGCTSNLFLNTVIPTRVLLTEAAASSVQRCVLVSSLAVYGTTQLQRRSVVDERTPLEMHPERRDPYTFSKWKQEQVAWQIHRSLGLPLVVVRPGVIYGHERSAITTRVGLSLGSLLIRVGGRQRLPYVFVDHCSRGVVLAGLTPGLEGQAINLVDDELPTGNQIVGRYRQSSSLNRRVVTVPLWTLKPLSGFFEWYHGWSRGQIPEVITRYKSAALWKPLRYSNHRAKECLHWQPTCSLDEALSTTVAE